MAVTQISRIQHRRGKDTDLPEALAEGEIGMATNTGELFIGAPSWDRIQHRRVGAASPTGIYPYANIKLLTEFDVAHTLSDTVYYHGPLFYTQVSSGTVSVALKYVYGVDQTEEKPAARTLTALDEETPVDEPPVEEPPVEDTPTDPVDDTPVEPETPEDPWLPRNDQVAITRNDEFTAETGDAVGLAAGFVAASLRAEYDDSSSVQRALLEFEMISVYGGQLISGITEIKPNDRFNYNEVITGKIKFVVSGRYPEPIGFVVRLKDLVQDVPQVLQVTARFKLPEVDPEDPTEPVEPPAPEPVRQTRYTFLNALAGDQQGAIPASLSIDSRHGTSGSSFVMSYDNTDTRTGRPFYEEMVQFGRAGTMILDITPARLQALSSTDTVNLTYHPAQTIYRVALNEADSMVIDYSVQAPNAFPNEQVSEPGARRVGTLHVVADLSGARVRDDHVELNTTSPMRVTFSARVEVENEVSYLAVCCVNAHGQPMDVVFNGRRWSSKRF